MSEAKLDEILAEVKEIRKVLFGNGKVGLCEQVRDNSEQLKKFKPASILTILLIVSVALGVVITLKSFF